MDKLFYQFPEDFMWGAATASYQIEGARKSGGRGESVWDSFSRRPGKVLNNDSGEGACDHYNRWQEDIGLMKNLGLQTYRFSLAWPRIFPNGEGEPNPEGVAFYTNLIDGLLEAGIRPFITLFHWDLPQALQDKYGGWPNKDMIPVFVKYAEFCVKTWGEKVKDWATMNEIVCFTRLAHEDDKHAPGGREGRAVANQAVHNALVAHGRAVKAMRTASKTPLNIGIVENITAYYPCMADVEHIEATKKAYERVNSDILFPLLRGKYDEAAYKEQYGELPEILEGEMEDISAELDYIGYNYYAATAVRASDNEDSYEILDFQKGYPVTDMGWPITPEGIYWMLKFSHDYFPGMPVYICENGMAADDKEEENGEVIDMARLEYYRAHLKECARAAAEGVPLKRYYAWSLMDNFEWSFGYAKRFGLYRVNYQTYERKLKLSGDYYRKIISANGVY